VRSFSDGNQPRFSTSGTVISATGMVWEKISGKTAQIRLSIPTGSHHHSNKPGFIRELILLHYKPKFHKNEPS
jgi:hypothetical protein